MPRTIKPDLISPSTRADSASRADDLTARPTGQAVRLHTPITAARHSEPLVARRPDAAPSPGPRARPRPAPPAPGQESAWDYPRPPRLEPTTRRLEVFFAGVQIADSQRGYRVLETSHPPVYYLPPGDVRLDLLEPSRGQTLCEFKGAARYLDVVVQGERATRAAWTYVLPDAAFAPIAGFYAFYAGRLERCLVDGQVVSPQAGDFYGGWITPDVVGPFKGSPDSLGW